MNKIVCSDNVTYLKTMPESCVDLTVTSPPYDNLREYEGFLFDFDGVVKELYRVTKEGGIVVWVVADQVIDKAKSCSSFRQCLRFLDFGFLLHDTMIWEKNGSVHTDPTRYLNCFEYMFVFKKGKEINTFNPIIDRKNIYYGQNKGDKTFRKEDGKLIRRHRSTSSLYGKRTNIWKISRGLYLSTKDSIAYKHPAIFPEKLAEDHILTWTNENDLVLDPFCGSGTTCKMAKKNKRQYIGIDISENYCKIAEKRVKFIETGYLEEDILEDKKNQLYLWS